MINKDLIEELETGLVLSDDQLELEEVNYDTIPIGKIFAVRLQTGSYTIMQKSETFDDKVLKKTENYDNTIAFLKHNS